MMNRVVLVMLPLVILGGALLWLVQYQPWRPNVSEAQFLDPNAWNENPQTYLKQIDTDIAAAIRSAANKQWSWPDLSSLTNATLSATMRTTPEELWKTMREQGAQAVLGSVVSETEFSVGELSTNMLNEARYQYCQGVVETYQRSPQN